MSDKRQKQQLKTAPTKAAVRPKTETPTLQQAPAASEALQRALETPIQAASAEDILTLQRAVGNRATQRVVERQRAVATGQATAQPAVQPLVTAPRGTVQPLFETGMAKGEALGTYAKGARGVLKDWATMTPNRRAIKLAGLAIAQLTKLGVPAPSIAVKNLGSSNGSFSHTTWTLNINTKLVSKTTITEAEVARLSNTVYHEARHCEQFFRAARLWAGDGKKKEKIVAEFGIPGRIAAKAVAKPLKPLGFFESLYKLNAVAERNEARAWAEALGKEGTKKYVKIMNRLDKAEKDYDTASKAYATSPSVWKFIKMQAARLVYKSAYDDYRSTAEEKDAWKVGGMAEKAFGKAGKKQKK